MEGKASFTDRVSSWTIQGFVEKIIQGRKVLRVEENRNSTVGVGKAYLVYTAPYAWNQLPNGTPNKKTNPPEEFIICEFWFYYDGIKYEGEWVKLMAKNFGKEYIEAYRRHEEERIEQELESAKANCTWQKEVLAKGIKELFEEIGIN